MKIARIFPVALLLTALLFSACSTVPSSEGVKNMEITVSILPEKYFVERVGGDLVTVNVMVGPGDSPHL
jgi:zinc transport system substrate-binding protein